MNFMMRRIRSFPLALLLGVTSFVHVSGSLAQTVPIVSKKDAEDAQFKVYFGARDGQLAFIGEIKRLQAYHETLKVRLRSSLAEYSRYIEKDLADAVELAKNSITAEIIRTTTFLTEYNKAKDNKLIEAFDQKYPINYKQLLRGEKGGFTVIHKPFNVLFLRSERQNIVEVFRNISNENRGIYTKYDELFANMDTDFAKFERPAMMEQLNSLPQQFTYLANKDTFDSMSAEDVSASVNRYLEVLKKSAADLTAFSSNPETIKANVEIITRTYLAGIDKIGEEVATQLKNAVNKLDAVETSIAGSARALYGNKVGSDSFNYLLYVFAAVFALIMLMPRLYSAQVANNILKAEFLLQFSTVFVLVAAIIILGIGDLIDKQQLPVLLAGISGYVLGQLGQVKPGDNTNVSGSAPSAGAAQMRHPLEGTNR
jgi:hypothetical protein